MKDGWKSEIDIAAGTRKADCWCSTGKKGAEKSTLAVDMLEGPEQAERWAWRL